jgi:hypothetical protein
MDVRCLLLCLGTALAGPSMVAQQPTQFLTEAELTVKWSGIPPTSDPSTDWVSLWWAPLAATYIQFVNITQAVGSGSATFSVVNGRHPFVFRYYRDDTVLAESNLVYPEASYPLQLRLSLVGDSQTQMRVSWTSNNSNPGIIQYGLAPDKLTLSAPSTTATITHDEMNTILGLPPIPPLNAPFANISSRQLRCGYVCYRDNTTLLLWVDPGIFHNAIVADLQPSTKYYYRVGEEGGLMSDVYYFYSRSPPGSAETVTLLYLADGGIGGNGNQSAGFAGGAANNDPPQNGADAVWKSVIADSTNAGDDLVLFNGDISYARGWSWTWEVFFQMTSPFLRHIPSIISFGNHEMDYGKNGFSLGRGPDSGGEAGIAASRRFNALLPTTPEAAVSLVTYGPVTLITLSSENDIATQASFLSSALASVKRDATPWVVVQVHRPLYSSSTVDEIGDLMKLQFVPLFEKFSVDVVLAGHQHFYERMCAIRDGDCGQGPVYIVDGSSGAEFSPTSTPFSKLTKYKDFSLWGYSRLNINRTTLTWTHYHTNSTAPADQVTLQK